MSSTISIIMQSIPDGGSIYSTDWNIPAVEFIGINISSLTSSLYGSVWVSTTITGPSGVYKFKITRNGTTALVYYRIGTSSWIYITTMGYGGTGATGISLYAYTIESIPNPEIPPDPVTDTVTACDFVQVKYDSPIQFWTDTEMAGFFTELPVGFYYSLNGTDWIYMCGLSGSFSNWSPYLELSVDDQDITTCFIDEFIYNAPIDFNVWNDSFTGSDDDAPNSAKWEEDVSYLRIKNNSLRALVLDGGGRVKSKSIFTGAFDLQCKTHISSTDNGSIGMASMQIANNDWSDYFTVVHMFGTGLPTLRLIGVIYKESVSLSVINLDSSYTDIWFRIITS